MPGGRIRKRPGLPGGRPGRKGPDAWQDTMREYESRANEDMLPFWNFTTSTAQTITNGTTDNVVLFASPSGSFSSTFEEPSGGIVTLRATGIYAIGAQVRLASPTDGIQGVLDLRILEPDGTATQHQTATNTAAAAALSLTVQLTTLVQITQPNTQLYLTFDHSDAANPYDLQGSAPQAHRFWGFKVREL